MQQLVRTSSKEIPMQFLSRTRLLTGLMLLAAMLPAGTARGQGDKKAKKIEPKSVTFKTFDGVELAGNLYLNAAGKRDAVVLMIPDFDLKKGGGITKDGWSDLASALHADGFTVLSFDFRGFGDSKNVDPDFWKHRHNNTYIRGALKKPQTLDHKNFNPAYVPYLVNDIAAAKAYLDRRNDAREVNSSNVVVIGAGEGATLGALWLASECRRRRDTNVPPGPFPMLAGQSEISDYACAVWLSMSPTLGKRATNIGRWVAEAGGRSHKVPMGFLYGKGDSRGDDFARKLVSLIKPRGTKNLQNTTFRAVPDTKLAGSELLQNKLDTIPLVRKYLTSVFEERKSKEQKDRKSEASQYWYVNTMTGRAFRPSKKAGQESPEVVLSLFGNFQ
jgi:pimeloyl-ACP methyl ester carboxylesterase